MPLSLFLSSPKATAAAAGEESPRASLPSSLRRVHAHATIEAPKPDRTVPFLPLPLLFLRDYLQSDQKRILQMSSLSTAWARRSRSILPGHPVRDVGGESRAPVLFWPPVAAYQFPYGLRHRFFDRAGATAASAAGNEGRMTQGRTETLIGKAHPPPPFS